MSYQVFSIRMNSTPSSAARAAASSEMSFPMVAGMVLPPRYSVRESGDLLGRGHVSFGDGVGRLAHDVDLFVLFGGSGYCDVVGIQKDLFVEADEPVVAGLFYRRR